jgi:hypothetical protein
LKGAGGREEARETRNTSANREEPSEDKTRAVQPHSSTLQGVHELSSPERPL